MTTGMCYSPDAPIKLTSRHGKSRFYRTPFHVNNNKNFWDIIQGGSDSPCTDDVGITGYFSSSKVHEQLHITRKIDWAPCADIDYHMANSSLNFFDSFKQKGLKVLLYSGNVDAVVPYT